MLRAIKRLSKLVEEHGRRYRDALDEHWSQSDLTRKEAEVILRRMDNVLDQLPEARRQAHERIIGERKVANGSKILSLYESDVHVIVRGKAGAEVEFGNSLFLAENSMDSYRPRVKARDEPGGWKMAPGALSGDEAKERGSVSAEPWRDRGFNSKATERSAWPKSKLSTGYVPKDPRELARRMRGR